MPGKAEESTVRKLRSVKQGQCRHGCCNWVPPDQNSDWLLMSLVSQLCKIATVNILIFMSVVTFLLDLTSCSSKLYINNNIITVLQPLYRSVCISRHLQLRTGMLLVQSFTARMPLLKSKQRSQIRMKTLEFSSTVLSTLSLYFRSSSSVLYIIYFFLHPPPWCGPEIVTRKASP